MRKSFTRLFSIFLLLLGLSFQMAYGFSIPSNLDGANSIPTDENSNAKPADFATKFVVAFDVAPVISDAGGTLIIYKGASLFKTIPVSKTSGDVVVVGKTLEITHGIASFTAGESYKVVLTAGTLTDGGLVYNDYNFTIGDYVAPKLLTTGTFVPALGATNVQATLSGGTISLSIPFDEAVTVPTAANSKAVYIYKKDGTIVDIIKVGTVSSTTITGLGTATIGVPVANTAIFEENTEYYVVIDAGAFVDSNAYANKNPFAGLATTTTWVFSTRDNSAPVISAKTVTAIATTSATLNVTLAEAGKYYYLVQLASAADATAATVSSTGTAITVATAGANVTASLAGLTGGVAYKVWIVTENSVGIKSATAVNVAFTTVDFTAPLSVARGSLNDADKKTYALYMVFDELIQGGAGNLDLRKNSDESYVKTIAASAITSRLITAAEVTANTFGSGRTTSQTVTIVDLGMTLASNVAYYVVFPSGFIKDLAGNVFTAGSFVNPINKNDWPVTSSDFELPTVTASFANPASLSSAINLTFNETIQKQVAGGSWGDVVALEKDNTTVTCTVTPASGTNTNVITITPSSALTSNTVYTVRLRKDAVKDISTNANAITTEQVYTLTTGDLDVLTVAYGSSEGATVTNTLTSSSTVKIDFNKAIKVNTTGSTYVAADATNLLPLITLTKAAVAVPFVLTYDATNFTATLTPSAALANNSTYVLTFNGTKVVDVYGTNTLTAATTTYTVVDYTAPVVTLGKSGNVSSLANPTISFDEDVRLLAGVATIADGTAVTSVVTFKENNASGANLGIASVTYTNKVITIVPAVALSVGKTYYYGIGASVKDASGNVAPATFGTFTMVDPVVPPTIVANTYTLNGSAQTALATKLVNIKSVSSSVNLTVTFNDNVRAKTPYAAVNLLLDNVSVASTTITAASVSGNTLSLSFSVGSTLSSTASDGKEYVISLPTDLVEGSTAYTTSPTAFASLGTSTITFVSADVTSPTVTSVLTYDSTNTSTTSTSSVALDTILKLQLSEKVVLGSGNILIGDGTSTQTIAINATNVTLDAAGTLATVVKSDLTKYATVYTVVVPVGAFADDVSGNPSTATSTTFTTLANPVPVVSTYTPADNSDQLSTAGTLTMVMKFSEEVIKYDPLVGSRKQWFLIENTGTGSRASLPSPYDLIAGNDVVVASNYIETSTVGISGLNVTIATGFTPVAGKNYYVLITPGAFLDKSLPTAGAYVGIVDPTTWNFTTSDANPGAVTFTYTKRADDLVAKTSDITINFSRPIKNGNGTAITNDQIATLFTLNKNTGGNTGTKAFVGTISDDKKTVTVLNSSLVTLGELTELSEYTIQTNGTVIYANGTTITGATNTFTTSDYTAGTVTATIADAILDVTASTATVTFDVSDNHNLAKVYYTVQAGTAATATPTADVVMADKSATVTGTSTSVTYQFTGLAEETSYVVWTVVADAAGNVSPVSKVVFITDDVTKPLIASLPTSFDSNSKLTFVFNEAVNGASSCVRIIDAASMSLLATLDLVGTSTTTLVTTAFAGLATSTTTVNYYVEVTGGLVTDVPVVAGDVANTFAGLYGTSLMVASTDKTIPVLSTTTPSLPATDQDVNFSIKLNFNEAVKKATTIPANAFVVNKWNGSAYEAFEVVNPANVSITDKVATVTLSRTLASVTTYQLIFDEAAFTDLAGNSASGTVSGTVTTKDVVAPAVVFSPANLATGVASTTTTLTLTFAEAIRLLDDSEIDKYDLDSLVYVKKGVTPVTFTTSLSGGTLTITTAALGADATYTYGFKAKFEDSANNAIPAASATFTTVTTTPAAQYLTWTPAKNATAPWLGKVTPVILTFSGPIFTFDGSVAANSNLPVTAAYLAGSVLSVTQTVGATTTPTAAADLLFTVIDSKTISVAPKAGTQWISGATVSVTFNANKIQINEGNTTPVPGDVSAYKAEDTVAPLVLTYSPAKVGVDGVLPVVAKTSAVSLVFNEDVKVGTGTYEIYRWDGLLATSGLVTVGTDTRTVTLGSLAALPTNVEYYAIVNPGAVVDVTDSNPYAGMTTVKSWKFMLKDDAVPAIVSYLPNTTNTPVDADLTITFDRPVDVIGMYVALYKSAAGGDAVQIWRGADNATTNAFSVLGSTATIELDDLAPNTKYFVELAAGTYGSDADNSKTNVGIERSVWSFSTEVNDNPLAVTYAPAKAAASVTLGSDLKITFDQDVVAGTGNIQLMRKQASGGYIITNYNVTDATKVVFAGTTLTIPSAVIGLQENSEYYVIVPTTAVKNTSYTPNYFAGVTVPFEWSFSTVSDATAPTLTVTAPVAPIAKVFTVGLTFSEAVTGVASGTTVTGGTVAVTGSGSTYSLTVTAEESSLVTIVLANTIVDLATPANAFAGQTLSYTTSDLTAPTLVSSVPANGTTITDNHPKPLSFTLSEAVKLSVAGGKLNITKVGKTTPDVTVDLTAAMVSGSVVSVTYASGLDKNSDYYVTVDAGAIEDLAGNAFAGITASNTWTFKTGANFATPVIEPVDNSLEFKVYPNPFVDYVTVENASELSKVIVSNIAGQIVKEVVAPENTIQLSELRSGVYFISLYDMDNVIVKTAKIVKR